MLSSKSNHAHRRQQQRCVSDVAIDVALAHGTVFRQINGCTVYFVGRRQVAAAARTGQDIRRYNGTAIVMSKDATLVTVIRTRSTARFRRGSR